MNTTLKALLLAVLCAVPVAAQAAMEAGAEQVGVGGALLFPVSSPLSKKMGQGGGAGVQYLYFRSPRVAVGLQADQFEFKDGDGAYDFSASGLDYLKADILSIQGLLRVNLTKGGAVIPHVTVGAGFNRTEQTATFASSLGRVESPATSLDLTYSAAGGIDIPLGGIFTLGVEGRIQRFMTDYDDLGSNGFTASGAGLRLNCLF